MITEFCVNCGERLPFSGIKFCPACGVVQHNENKGEAPGHPPLSLSPTLTSTPSSTPAAPTASGTHLDPNPSSPVADETVLAHISQNTNELDNQVNDANSTNDKNIVSPRRDIDDNTASKESSSAPICRDESQNKKRTYNTSSEHLTLSPPPDRKKAENIYNSIKQEKFKECLFKLLQNNTRGLKAFFVGNQGSYKDHAYDEVAEILYNTGKVSSTEPSWHSFTDMPDCFDDNTLYVIYDLQSAVDNLFNLDDLSGESVAAQRRYQEKLEKLIAAPGSCYIILDGTAVEHKGFCTLSPKIPFLFKNAVVFPDLSDEEVFSEMVSNLTPELKRVVDNKYKSDYLEFLQVNRKFFPFNNLELARYLAGECVMKGELVIPEGGHRTESLDALFSSVIGMNSVKKKLTELNEYLTARAILEKQGATLPNFNLNMMFLGNPGVGKTTIARIIAQILFDLGYIKENKLIECTSKDLVSSYAGLTGVKTNRVISRAMGGVLFIDEAYALSNSCGQAGAEAIAILIKAMEDFKGEFVTMFAGYTNEMDDFVKSNSGIESRISYNFFFADYSTDELLDIFKLKLGKTGMIITQDGLEAARNILKFVAGKRNFGNGRFVDKMLQAVLTKHATLGLSADDLMCIRKESIPKIEEIMQIK